MAMVAFRSVCVLGWFGAGVALAGCGASGSGGGGRGLPEFPSRERLDEIARQRVEAPFDASQKIVSVDDWESTSEPAAASAEQDLVRRVLGKGQRRVTAELGCAAREIARFMAVKGGVPDQRLRNHLLGRCGDWHPAHTFQSWSVDLGDSGESDASLLGRLGASLGEAEPNLPKGPVDLGGALVREGRQAVFVLTYAERQVEMAPVAIAEDGTVTLEGKLSSPTQFLQGLITAGELGVAPCRFDRALRLPRFRLSCSMAPGDASAWVDVQRTEPGRLLARSVVRVLARRPEPAPSVAEGAAPEANTAQPEPVSAAPVAPLPSARANQGLGEVDPSTASGFRTKLLGAVNELRREAGLPALKLADRQSARHEQLAPHFFASGGDDSFGEDIALGLMAGWEVPGTIRDGSFYGIALSGTLSADRWLEHLLDYPAARELLFAPDARALAVGPIVDAKSSSLGALLSTYSFYESADHGADREKVIEMLTEARRLAGSAPLRFVRDPELEQTARAVNRGKDLNASLGVALQQIAQREGGEVQALVFETMGVEYLEFPDDLVRSVGKVCGIEVTHVRHPEAPWGNLVVMMVLRRSGQVTASVATPERL